MLLYRHILGILLFFPPLALAQDFDDVGLRHAVNAWLVDSASATATYGAPIGSWKTWRCTDMSRLFQGAIDFNEDISGWDTSSVTDFHHIFAGAESFDGDLSRWDVSQVTDFSSAFYGARSFTGESLSTWNTSSAITMEQMFLGAREFVGPDNIQDWDTSSVTSMYAMFFDATSFNRTVDGWNMANVQYTNSMFEAAAAFSQYVCWNDISAAARFFQCFCGTSDAAFDTSSDCSLSVHPSILAYSQACDPNDILEQLVESQIFGRPEDSEFLEGLGGATGSFAQGVASLPMLSNPSVDEVPVEEEEEEAAEGSDTEAARDVPTGELQETDRLDSEQPDDLIVTASQKETSAAASSWRRNGRLTPLLALLVATMTRFC